MSFFKFLGSKTFLYQIILAIIAIFLLIYLALHLLKSSTNHGEFTVVPDLSRKTFNQAKLLLDNAGLRAELVDSTNFNPNYPRFSVIEQNPAAGEKVKENRKIYLKINRSGYEKVTVPDLIQVTFRNATSIVKAVGLEIKEVEYVDNIGKDMVLGVKYEGKEIKAGTKIPKTSRIVLVCGNGKRN
ncbi:PASTA domain-containing protein [Abyssalbus ytuae]|uniref:PASTA domain-containing protein n=1 Tax=Abyssalbus ytuae TaxID=2926907 RepID=A0A9E6ZU85_9FLAO|nr:PASTA domain-containing protein [Abyssalbus ytuae]UOB16816.1 PASTA domain-containing protein [Abyssalbus ytuae]